MFIAFDGIDASGKTTQTKLLYERLKRKHVDVQVYSMGQEGYMDDIFLNLKLKQMKCDAEIRELLYYFEGVLFGKSIIEPLLGSSYKIAIVDRYLLSFYSYGPINGVSHKRIETLTQLMPWPDLYFFVDISPDKTIERITKYRKVDAPEVGYKNQLSEDEEVNRRMFVIHQKMIYDNYRKAVSLFGKSGKQIVILDGNQSADELSKIVYEKVNGYLNNLTKNF